MAIQMRSKNGKGGTSWNIRKFGETLWFFDVFRHWTIRFPVILRLSSGFTSGLNRGPSRGASMPGTGDKAHRGAVESGGGAWVSGRDFRVGFPEDLRHWGPPEKIRTSLWNHHGINKKPEIELDGEHRQQPYFMAKNTDFLVDFTLN